jgi:hypothetical protein
MYRRRRPLKSEAIQFSFDSFLDLVTNVVGIIIRLILVTWVGARSYHASMQWLEVETTAPPAPTPAVKITDDPLHHRIELSKRDLDDAKTLLLSKLKKLSEVEKTTKVTDEELAKLVSRRNELEAERASLAGQLANPGKVRRASLTVDDVRRRSKQLLEEIKKIESAPSSKKQLKYHAPVSRAVRGEELFFECKGGRVTFIDMPSFKREFQAALDDAAGELRTKWRVERVTSPVGPYRLRYLIERERTALDTDDTPTSRGFRYGVAGWQVEPLTPDRGETAQQALTAKSEFRQLTDALDANLTTVTFWVYPDSFELFRQLRDHLYERGHDVAGRPLPMDAPIAASKHGTASRGQ